MPSRPAKSPRPAKPSRTADHLRLVQPATAAMSVATAASTTAASTTKTMSAATKTRAVGDWILNGLGVGAATASAGFATYALVFSTGAVVPSGNFNLFARYDNLHPGPTLRTGQADPPAAGALSGTHPAQAATETATREGVDFTPTGSVGPGRIPAEDDRGTQAAKRGGTGAENRPLPGFTLRDVFDGKALVESKSSLSVVKLGSVIEGAGEVLSIEKRGERWEVRTAGGVITGQRK